MNSWLELNLTNLVYGGTAMGRLPDGRAVFVPFGLPGERVRVELVAEKRGHALANLQEVVHVSPLRVAPPCRYFSQCGGCHYQHLPYEAQLAAKTAILGEQLTRIGQFKEPPIQPAVPSPRNLHYRNYIQLHLSPEGRLGFINSQGDQVLPIQECLLPELPLLALWKQLDFEAIPGLERIGMRLGRDDDIQLILESQDLLPPEVSVEELPISIAHLSQAGTLVLAGSSQVTIEILGRPFQVSAASFFQVNTDMAGALVEHLFANLDLTPQDTILDVYCGVGLFSAFIAPQVGRLIGIEANQSACEDLVINLDEFENVELYEAPAEDVLPHLDIIQPRLVVLDPPRTGLERGTLDALSKIKPDSIAYVSCDPSTLARDARRLVEGGYQLKQVTPFDLFPQTYHIESVSFFELR